MSKELSRRRLLQLAGTATAGTVALAGTAAADESGRREHDGSGGRGGSDGSDGGAGDDGDSGDDGDPPYPSAAWFRREQENYAKTTEEPRRQAKSPEFQARWQAQSQYNSVQFRRRTVEEPGWNSEGNLCKEWSEQCCGDPFLYPENPTYEGHPFYADVGERRRVAFYDSGLDVDEGGARLSGRVWVPADSQPGDELPGVVITNGSVQAPETLYWWFALTLVRAGYIVLTYDPRGQGRSDTMTPDGTQGSNAHPSVFVTNQVDAIDLFRSTPENPYPHNTVEPGEVPAPVVDHNPFYDRLDHDRLGIVGYSLGATGVSIVQGIADANWPGAIDDANPADVAVAWDNLAEAGEELAGYTVTPRVPAMGQSGDYHLTPTPKTEPPDEEADNAGFNSWVSAGVDSYQLNVRGGTHYEWSRVPSFPTTFWTFGNALADHYSLAWLDYYLKSPGAPGPEGTPTPAVQRLLADDEWRDHLSFYYRSARAFDGHDCADVAGEFEED